MRAGVRHRPQRLLPHVVGAQLVARGQQPQRHRPAHAAAADESDHRVSFWLSSREISSRWIWFVPS
jgi:hypothetical protein